VADQIAERARLRVLDRSFAVRVVRRVRLERERSDLEPRLLQQNPQLFGADAMRQPLRGLRVLLVRIASEHFLLDLVDAIGMIFRASREREFAADLQHSMKIAKRRELLRKPVKDRVEIHDIERAVGKAIERVRIPDRKPEVRFSLAARDLDPKRQRVDRMHETGRADESSHVFGQ
jgi:hypothetical protein